MITSAGIGSGVDFESIIQASVKAKKAKLFNNKQIKIDEMNETISAYGKLESLIDKLRNYKDKVIVDSKLDVEVENPTQLSLDIKVKQLAKPNLWTTSLPSDFSFSDFEVIVDGETKTIHAKQGDTVTDIRDRLVAAGVNCTVVKKDSENVLMIEAESVTGLGSWVHSKGQDAIIEVNGLEIRSETNEFSNIDGIKFKVHELGNFNIDTRTESNFEETYDSVIKEIEKLTARGEYVDGKWNNRGALTGSYASYAKSVLAELKRIGPDQESIKSLKYNDDFVVDSLNMQVHYETDQLSRNEQRLADYEADLRRKYAALDSLIAGYNSSLGYLV